ncbi:MAG TPA: hypothetical protein VFH45_09085, partial [Acidimicrobiales bacterium]|nr:hypothetical protein [Acidimicrobiales bacterium]
TPSSPSVPVQVLGTSIEKPAVPAAPVAQATSAKGLAFTGADLGVVGSIGLGLLGAGGLMTRGARRRRRFGRG